MSPLFLLTRRPGYGAPRAHLRSPSACSHGVRVATFVDAKVKWVRDRGLDHAVEKEKHLRPLHALKNLLLRRPLDGPSSPTPVPLSAVAERRDELGLPFRAICFVRKYPSAFVEEDVSSNDHRILRISATPELIRLHEEEQLLYQSCRAETADRLLRLLMLTPRKRIPLSVVDRLRWDIGLPDDYARSLLPEYPDYFQIVSSDKTSVVGGLRGSSSGNGSYCSRVGRLDLELVCWNEELAVSAMERWAMKAGGYRKGAPLAFPLHFSRGFDLEKKVRRWIEEWQLLPYLSPYEDAGRHLDPSSDLAEKWMVGMLHEILHLLVNKKTERDDLILLGECVGLRPGFKKVLVHHPGIFYISNKIRAHTVVLREAYKRDLLVEKHPLTGIRYQFIHLMRQSAAMDSKMAPRHDVEGGKKTGSGQAKSSLEGSLVDNMDAESGNEDDESDIHVKELLGDSEVEDEAEDEEISDDEEDDDHVQVDSKGCIHSFDPIRSIDSQRSQIRKQPFGAERNATSSSTQVNSVAQQLLTRKVSRPFVQGARTT